MNYRRFYGIVRSLKCEIEKEALVKEFTGGRTCSLREMKTEEYKAMCDALEGSLKGKQHRDLEYSILRTKRSYVLHQMQRMGINTSDWDVVDRYCLNKRIAGKIFRKLSADDLDLLLVKLRSIERKQHK